HGRNLAGRGDADLEFVVQLRDALDEFPHVRVRPGEREEAIREVTADVRRLDEETEVLEPDRGRVDAVIVALDYPLPLEVMDPPVERAHWYLGPFGEEPERVEAPAAQGGEDLGVRRVDPRPVGPALEPSCVLPGGGREVLPGKRPEG